MTAATAPASVDRSDWRLIVTGGAKLGLVTAAGVVAFSLLSRSLTGTTETIVQAILILVFGAVFAFLPAHWVRPRSVDGIAWAAMLGLMGSLFFAVLDIAVLRRVGIYPWAWDLIGGGSPYWYLPVWLMGSAIIAWLGAWTVTTQRRGDGGVLVAAAQAEGLAIVLFGVFVMAIGPFHAAMMALAYVAALALLVAVSAVFGRK
jgi:hypothetical protein